MYGTPNGIRTRAATLKGWCPRPLDDGGLTVTGQIVAHLPHPGASRNAADLWCREGTRVTARKGGVLGRWTMGARSPRERFIVAVGSSGLSRIQGVKVTRVLHVSLDVPGVLTYFTNMAPKDWYMKQRGITVDVWCDDCPD